jgi:hypothetical protein
MRELSNMIDVITSRRYAVMKLTCGNEPVSLPGSRQSSEACGGAIIAVALSSCWPVTF